MPPDFKKYKSLIDTFLLEFIESKRASLTSVNKFGPDLIDRIKKMVVAGKTIRGSLVLLAYRFSKKTISTEILKAAAAMELMQTALVIHDDVMDKDDYRRGIPAIHKQYNSEALAICAGDVLFFMGFELLGSLHTDEVTLGRIIRLVGREYQNVGVAQMADVAGEAKTKEEMISLYTYKTARYTFSVPLLLGITLAGTTKDMIKYLSAYGESVGVLFQITDDTLDRERNPFTARDIQAYKKAATESIHRLTINDMHKRTLRNLLEYVVSRKS